jgi:hypothetical protein
MRWPRWPQKVRTRLALLYAALFLVSGSALLALTNGLVAANLPAQSSTAQAGSGFDSNQLAKLRGRVQAAVSRSRHGPGVQTRLQRRGDQCAR